MIAFRLNGQATTYDAIQPFRSFPISAMTATSRRPRTLLRSGGLRSLPCGTGR